MTDITFHFIGWCNETDPDGTKHDKVWTSFSIGDQHYAGWGKRGKAISFKDYGSSYSAKREQERVTKQKRRKYDEVDEFQLFTIFPYFKEEVEQRLVFAMLSGKIK